MTKVSTGSRICSQDQLTVSQLGLGAGSGGTSGSLMYPYFDGTAYATIPAWTPKSAQWGVEVVCTPETGTLNVALGDGDANVNWLRLDTVNQTVEFKIGGSATSAFPELIVQAGVEAHIVFLGNSAAQTLDCYYNGVKLTQQPIGAALPVFTTVGRKQTDYFVGPIKYIRTFDYTPLQGVRAMAGDGASRYAAINPGTIAGDYYASFWGSRDTGDLRPLGRAADFNSRIFVAADGSINWRVSDADLTGLTAAAGSFPASTDVFVEVQRVGSSGAIKVNGVTVASGTVHTGGFSPTSLYVQSTSYSAGHVAELVIHDLTTGKVWAYNNQNDTGNLLVNSSDVDRLGAHTSDVPIVFTSGASTGSASNREIYFKAPVNEWISVGFDGVPAGRYRVSFDLEVISGGMLLTDKAETAVFAAAPGPLTTSGHYSFDITTPLGFRFKRDGAVGPDECYIRNISIRRIYSLATAAPLNGTESNAEAQAKGHGIWYQSGAAMTSAAADAARTYLPWINRDWIFSKIGQIYDRLTGAVATLFNLDSSDWKA